ncbi:hypothetical protein KDA_05740 [Dictyobacter alpinus]|uniref:Uncharacterized protein n=1 Tax=Dictyobacter alpinus TaxID=2014873 RepID=A0A402B155_9CHLR|nr:hypothetical protein KDA_05740 [Dictyobacter alpinus]
MRINAQAWCVKSSNHGDKLQENDDEASSYLLVLPSIQHNYNIIPAGIHNRLFRRAILNGPPEFY